MPKAKAWDLANNIFKLTDKDKATFYFPAGECVLPLASTKELEEREFVVDSGPSMHTVSKKDLDSAELETNEDIKKSDDGDDGQRRGANQRRSMNWTYSSLSCFFKKLPQYFLWRNSVRIMRVHTTQKWQEN